MPKREYQQPAKSAAYCRVCSHPDRHRIELAIARHVPYRAITREFGVTKDSAWRHRTNHMAPELEAALAFDVPASPLKLDELRKSESEALLQTAVIYRGRLLALLERPRKPGTLTARTGSTTR